MIRSGTFELTEQVRVGVERETYLTVAESHRVALTAQKLVGQLAMAIQQLITSIVSNMPVSRFILRSSSRYGTRFTSLFSQ